MQLDDLIGKYLKIRDGRDELKQQHAEELKRFTNALTKIEQMIWPSLTIPGRSPPRLQMAPRIVPPEHQRKSLIETRSSILSSAMMRLTFWRAAPAKTPSKPT